MSENTKNSRENNDVTRGDENSTNNDFREFNKASITGIVEDEFEYSHEVFYERFYRTKIRVARKSGTEDHVPVVVSEYLLEGLLEKSLEGKWVEVRGQFRSHNQIGFDGQMHLDVYLFARYIKFYEDEIEEDRYSNNMIYLDGYLGKPPVYRITPRGIEITDFLVAVNRSCGHSDYIPCIAWGRTARRVGNFKVGDRVQLYGRAQSREYFKRESPESENGEYREVYEISVMSIREIRD